MTMVKDAERIKALLPFFVNGTLEGEEREMVRAALQKDPELERERKALSALRERIKADVPSYSPGKIGLARLMREIDQEASRPRSTTRRYWVGTGVAAALVAMAFLVLPTDRPGDELYEQASGAYGEGALIVTFRPDARQGAIDSLLVENGLVIVDGPSALGLYRLNADAGVDLQNMIDRLASASELIESVERAQ